MSLKGIMSIAGMSGLFKLIAQTKTGFVVESMTDQKRYPISASQKISMLEDISVFTKGGDIALKEVLLKMKGQDEVSSKIDPKETPENLKKFFKSILPDFDEEKVYASDIKKMVAWYKSVKDLVDKEEEPAEKTDLAESITAAAANREHPAHLPVEHQKVKSSDKKASITRTRKKV